jgi:hypothetical protein
MAHLPIAYRIVVLKKRYRMPKVSESTLRRVYQRNKVSYIILLQEKVRKAERPL